jgi:hypothetical protein
LPHEHLLEIWLKIFFDENKLEDEGIEKTFLDEFIHGFQEYL